MRLKNEVFFIAPDYVVNVGGVINGCRELLGWTPSQSSSKGG